MKFNKKTHDQKIAALTEQDAQRVRGDVMTRIGKYWDQRTMAFRGKRRMRQNQVAGYLTALAEDMRAMVVKMCSPHKELHDFQAMTIMIIDDKIEELRLTEGWTKNVFIPWTPRLSTGDVPKGLQPVIARYTFKTIEEFKNIDAVGQAMTRDGFVGFVLDGAMVLGMDSDGDTWQVGRVASGIGLESIPGVRDMQEALRQNRRKN